MPRLDKERESRLEPDRMEYAREKISGLGFTISFENNKRIEFNHNGDKIVFFPYSGWHTGKSIKDGRGINNLIKQL